MTAQAGDTASSSKSALRIELRQARRNLSRSQQRLAATHAANHALRLIARTHARHVALYLATGFELNTGPLLARLRQRRLHVYAPRLHAGQIKFARLTGAILRNAKKMDLILLPLVGFDARGTRLGQGGGHYDRCLSFARPFRRPLLVGFAYAAQQTETLPRGPHDVRLDGVITERGLQWLTG